MGRILSLSLASILAFSQSHLLNIDVIYAATSQSCPNSYDANQLLPSYSLENKVAEFTAYIARRYKYENQIYNASIGFNVIAYNSNSKQNNPARITGDIVVNRFLEEANFNILEFYESNEPDKFHDKPSVIIYKDRDISYVMFDLEGPNNLADGKFEYVKCEEWHPDSIGTIGSEVLKKRAENMLKDRKKRHSPQAPILPV